MTRYGDVRVRENTESEQFPVKVPRMANSDMPLAAKHPDVLCWSGLSLQC